MLALSLGRTARAVREATALHIAGPRCWFHSACTRKRPEPELLRLGAAPLEALKDLGLEPGPALSDWLGPQPWPKHHRGFALVRGGEILATTRAALTSQYPACLAELTSASEETLGADEYICFFQLHLAHESDVSSSDGVAVREMLMGEVLHTIQSQHPRPKCIVLAPLKGFVPWLLEVRGHELLLTLGFDRSLASLMSKVLTAAESAQELDLNLSFR
eukprot:s369_g16.t1